MATDQTAGEPPRRGSTSFAKNGCTENRRNALTNKVAAVSGSASLRGLLDESSQFAAEISVTVRPLFDAKRVNKIGQQSVSSEILDYEICRP
jgi:hypothetical protein